MSRSLKNFMEDHRREFDDELPPPHIWQAVEMAIGEKKQQKKINSGSIYKWTAAAAVFLAISSGVYFFTIKNNKSTTATANEVPSPKNGTYDLRKIAPEYAAEASAIFKSIELQQLQLKAIAREQPGLYSQFAGDLAALDSSYRVLTTQAMQTPNREVIIKAMLQNLQLQAELLSKQLSIIQQFDNKKSSNEKNNHPRL